MRGTAEPAIIRVVDRVGSERQLKSLSANLVIISNHQGLNSRRNVSPFKKTNPAFINLHVGVVRGRIEEFGTLLRLGSHGREEMSKVLFGEVTRGVGEVQCGTGLVDILQ